MQRKQVRLLVLDIDETAYCSLSKRQDKLAQHVIDHAMQGNYDGLYGCTHRSYLTLDFCKLEALRIAATNNVYDYDSITRNFATSKVMPAFAEATGLPLHAISMVDDVAHDRVGDTYETLVKPLEENGERARASNLYLAEERVFAEWHTKNPQLTQIAKHAVELYPNSDIVLDFLDDRRPLCEKAISAHKEAGWPENVRLNAFHCDYMNQMLIQVIAEPVAALHATGVFKPEHETETTAEPETTLRATP